MRCLGLFGVELDSRLAGSGSGEAARLVGLVRAEGLLARLSSVLSAVALGSASADRSGSEGSPARLSTVHPADALGSAAAALPPPRPADGVLPPCDGTGAPHPHMRFFPQILCSQSPWLVCTRGSLCMLRCVPRSSLGSAAGALLRGPGQTGGNVRMHAVLRRWGISAQPDSLPLCALQTAGISCSAWGRE